MRDTLLNAIIAMTAQRDIESLERSLLSSLAMMFETVSLAIYKPVPDNGPELMQETMRCWRTSGFSPLEWCRDGDLIKPQTALLTCITNKNCVITSNAQGLHEIFYPIAESEKIKAVICIITRNCSQPLQVQLNAMAMVYRNCLSILHENSHDPLTGLLNRKTFDKSFNQLITHQRKQQRIFVEEYPVHQKRTLHEGDQIFLAIADIDHFKHINDDYGHLFGDEILLLMTNLMRESFRSNDLLFRFGGEEFLVLLEPTDQAQANRVLEKFRTRVEEYKFPRVGRLSISIGFTAVREIDHINHVIDRADKALYYAKENGRNSTFFYDQLIQQGLLTHNGFVGSAELF